MGATHIDVEILNYQNNIFINKICFTIHYK